MGCGSGKQLMKLALIGDRNESVVAHQAIPLAIQLASDEIGVKVNFEWVDTASIQSLDLTQFNAFWCVPASPYKSKEGALQVIKYAREDNIPFLGTCGGYQHAVLEYAKNVLGYSEADTTEENQETSMPLISSLSCKLYGESGSILLKDNSQIANIYQSNEVAEEYQCGYGVNREYLSIFKDSDLLFSGFDADGDPRVIELVGHSFFIGTAFQPERSAFNHQSHPLISAFLRSTP